MRHTYEVIVGNIGTVYRGGSRLFALRRFNEYRRQSTTGRGRAGGEPITMFTDGEISAEHAGSLDAWEDRPGD
jgi:hypothetical protein